jgi:hypothetical protein
LDVVLKEAVVAKCMSYAGMSVENLRKNEIIQAAAVVSANNRITHLPTKVIEITSAPTGGALL